MENWKKNIYIFMFSQALSLLGSSLVQYAITWHITLTMQSGVYMTISILCGFLPSLLLSPFAGVWADRYDRKKLIMISDGFIALTTAALAIVFRMGYREIWLLFLASALRSLGSAIQTPSINAMIPDLVPREELTKINGINSSVQSIITLVSPAISAALFNRVALETFFMLDVYTAAIAIFIVFFFLKVPKVHAGAGDQSYFKEIASGFRYILSEGYLVRFFGYYVLFMVLSAPIAFLTPLQVTRTFGEGAWQLSAIEIGFSAGMFLGGLIIARWGGFKNRIKTLGVTGIALSIFIVALGLPTHFFVYLALMALCGVVMPLFNTPAIVLLQENIDSAFTGRVFSVMSMISSAIMPLSMLFFGPLADAVPIEWLLIITGAVMLVSMFVLMRDKVLLAVGEPRPAPEAASSDKVDGVADAPSNG